MMALRDLIVSIAEAWPAYRDKRKVDEGHPSHRLVTKDFPRELARLVPKRGSFIHYGSCGLGNISAAPWVATFDPRLTKSAQDGYYPVYLFSTDLERVYLSFGLGVTQFDRQFGENNTSIAKMRDGASRIRKLCEELAVPERLNQTSIDLSASSATRRYRAYQAGTVFAFPPYVLNDLPSDTLLESDYRAILNFYVRLVEDPAIPEVEDIVEAAVLVVGPSTVPEVSVFEPRDPVPPRRRKAGGGTPRRSAESRKVGNAGELAVIAAERHKLIRAGHPELAEQIDHLAARGETPGWDIGSFDEAGAPIYIEVKASKAATINSIEITRNEWRAAQQRNRRSRYHIYLVTNALSAEPKIEVIRDPFGYVKNNVLSAEPSMWELSLRGIG